jgi:hypothetical protein
MKVGKFMDKIGIVGQIALMFIPGIGPMLSTMFKGLGGIAATALSAMGPIGAQILKGAQFVIGKAGAYITSAKTAFKTVTQGVSNFVSEFTKTGLKKIGFNPTKFGFKPGGGLETWINSGSNSFGEAWGKVSANITENASKILDPFKSSITAGQNTTLKSISDSAFHSVDDIQKMNPQITDWGNIDGQLINLDSEFPINQMVPQGGFKTKVTTQQQYDQFWKKAASGMESKAVSELGSPTSLLAKYKDNPISGPMTEQSAADFKRILDSQDIAAPLGESTGFFDSAAGNAVQGVGTSIATSLATDAARNVLAGDPPEAPDYGYVVNAGLVAVQGAGAAIDYGIGGSFTPQPSSPATGLYDGRNTYAANFQAFYGAAG